MPNFIQIGLGVSSPHIREIYTSHVRYATLYACLLLFFGSSSRDTAETPAWILTLKAPNNAVLRKEVPFEGLSLIHI